MFYEAPQAEPTRTSIPQIPLKKRPGPTGPGIRLGATGNSDEGSRISKPVGSAMIAVAAIIDFSQFILALIPFIGWLIAWLMSICAWLLFAIWFHHHGVNLFSIGRALGTFGAMLGEAIPFINAFPWWTARVVVTVIYEWQR